MKTTALKLQEIVFPRQSIVKPIVLGGLALLAVAVSLYVYFVGKIVFDVVARRTAESSIQASESSLGTLGVSYFNQMKKIDLAQAENVGLSESHDILYASRTETTGKTVGMVTAR